MKKKSPARRGGGMGKLRVLKLSYVHMYLILHKPKALIPTVTTTY